MTYNAAEECSEQGLGGEVVADLLQTEQHTTNGRTKSNRYTTCGAGTQNLSAFSVIVAVLGEDTTCNVSNAGCNMNVWPLLA
jgi:hypothetical protein